MVPEGVGVSLLYSYSAFVSRFADAFSEGVFRTRGLTSLWRMDEGACEKCTIRIIFIFLVPRIYLQRNDLFSNGNSPTNI
jgi:hypothetical protein